MIGLIWMFWGTLAIVGALNTIYPEKQDTCECKKITCNRPANK